MNRHNLHPDTELLDQLRAGLLDGDPAQKTELQAHLEICQRCRQRYSWDGHLQVGGLAIADGKQRLDRARQRALRATRPNLARRLVPFAVAAAIAGGQTGTGARARGGPPGRHRCQTGTGTL